MPPTLHPGWAEHVLFITELNFVATVVTLVAAPRVFRRLSMGSRLIATGLLVFFVAIALVILNTSWSFTDWELNGRFLACGFVSLSVLASGWSTFLPKRWQRILLNLLLRGPIFAIATFSAIGVIGVAKGVRDRLPERQGQLDDQHTWQVAFYGGDGVVPNGAYLEFHSHLTTFPIVDKRIMLLRYDESEYKLNFLEVSPSPDGQKAIVVRRRLDDSLETTEIPFR